ncbi:MAG: prephenate dehydrogenase/arogenate dehydrogenase family protein [Methylophilaceae bacterium]|nr:prephenate dehydrogenase/arogenate dehydrogenase family protein [Methylophilaceae bacterium]
MKKLIIFGVGLMGGSLALALKRCAPAPHIIGFGRGDLNLALQRGAIDVVGGDIATALVDADGVILAMPVAQTHAVLQSLAPYLHAHTVVSDVGSTKTDVLAAAQATLGDKIGQFVGAHPVAGAEKSGVAAADASLFEGKNVILTPSAHTDPSTTQAIQGLWEACGAKVRTLSAEAHDAIFAAVSHLPQLAAFAFMHQLSQRNNRDTLLQFAASGFRDFTRIAASSPEMWRDISLANRSALLSELGAYRDALNQLIHLLETQDSATLLAVFETASQLRKNWTPP